MQNKLVNFTKQSIFDLIKGSVLAGLLISVASIFYVRCENKIVGAFLFSLGLIAVILLDAQLFTGKIGYVSSLQTGVEVVIIMIVNMITAAVVGLCYHLVVWPIDFFEVTRLVKDPLQMFYRGLICGICIYLAVELYNRSKNLLPVVLGVMAFILAGGTHCIADTFYLFAGPISWTGVGYVALTTLGNAIGAFGIHLLVRKIKILS